MSTVCKIVVRAPADAVAAILDDVLDAQWPALERVDSDWPLACDRSEWSAPVDAFPTRFSLGTAGDGFVEVHFNSFAKLDALASRLSWASGGPVVVNVHRSAGTASYWALHRDGQRVRWVEAGDGIVAAHGGARLPFEHDEPGRPVELDEDEQLFGFAADEVNWYNREAGVPVELHREPARSWVNFVRVPAGEGSSPENQRKPWWRFW